jgi:hypothetical protein
LVVNAKGSVEVGWRSWLNKLRGGNGMKSLKEIVTQLRDCGYTCEAGTLENNEDFRTLAKLADVELPKTLADCLAEAGKSAWNLGLSAAEAFGAIGRLAVRTPQDIRDETIEKAKRDVAELRDINGRYDVSDPHMFVPWSCNAEFIVNKEKRTVVALLRGYESGNVYARGIAKCDPTDCFNVHIGKAIALRRALGLEVPAEYLNTPQPTEVRVGDVVEYAGYKVTVMTSNRNCDYTHGTCVSGSFVSQNGKIIDDSHEEVAE